MAQKYGTLDAQGSDYFAALLGATGNTPVAQNSVSYYGNDAGKAALQQINELAYSRAVGDPTAEQALRDTLLNQARISTAQKAGQVRASGGRSSAGMQLAQQRVQQQAANEFATQVAQSRLQNSQVASQAAAQLANADRIAQQNGGSAQSNAAKADLQKALGVSIGTGLGGIIAGLTGPQTSAEGKLVDPTTGKTYESTDSLAQKASRIGGSLLGTAATIGAGLAGGPLAGAAATAGIKESGALGSLQNAINDWRNVQSVSPQELADLVKKRDLIAGQTMMDLNAAPLGGVDAVPFEGPVQMGFNSAANAAQLAQMESQSLPEAYSQYDTANATPEAGTLASIDPAAAESINNSFNDWMNNYESSGGSGSLDKDVESAVNDSGLF